MNSRRDVLHTTPTTRQQRTVPPPPAPAPAPVPGAVPQAGNNVDLRNQYEEFFRVPAENGAIPTPAPPPVPAPGPVPTNGNAAGPTPAPTAITEEDRIQTSIWGGPIQPGRFFAPPLGSIRRQPTAGPSRHVHIPLPTPIRTTSPQIDRNDTPHSAFPTPRHGFNSPLIPGSEATTPFSSNPPEVFRSMSSESESEEVASGQGAGEEVEIEGGRGGRRLAAEAAMRRMGLIRPGTKGKEKERAPEPTPTAPTPIPTLVKETYTPYLLPITRSAPHPVSDRSPWSKRGSLDDTPQPRLQDGMRGGMREGVEERLKTLKRVDDTIWGLVEELTRIRSLMDDENENQIRGEDGGQE